MSVEYPETWAVIDLFGHAKIAGKIGESIIGGQSFVRVDVPAVNGAAAYTRLYGAGAIYSIRFTTEAIATAVAEKLKEEPITPWDLPESVREAMQTRRLTSPIPFDPTYPVGCSGDYDWDEP